MSEERELNRGRTRDGTEKCWNLISNWWLILVCFKLLATTVYSPVKRAKSWDQRCYLQILTRLFGVIIRSRHWSVGSVAVLGAGSAWAVADRLSLTVV